MANHDRPVFCSTSRLTTTSLMDTPGKKRPTRLERAFAAGCMALLCIITFSNVLVRYLTNASFAFTEEVSVFLLLVLTLLGSVSAFAEGRHVRITLLVDKLPAVGKTICSLLEWAANVAMFALLAWSGYRMAFDDFEFEVTSPGLGLPQWLYTAWLPLLSAVIVIRLFLLALARRRKSS